MNVLAIETSCDETAVAIYSDDFGLLYHHIFSQVDLHKLYGGVVPELASRDHIQKTLPLIREAVSSSNFSISEIHGIAYTRGPGLIGSLMVGASVAHALAYAWKCPVIGVHHIEAHLMAVMLENQKPHYPFVALIISGGHTQLLHVQNFGKYYLLGVTLDDAVGEAFDKTASLLGFPYPGGAALSRLAEKGDVSRFQFPRPMLNRPGCDMSFSGLKTHAMQCIKSQAHTAQDRADIARAFEEAIVETLIVKSQRALELTSTKQLVVSGGVSANRYLRNCFHRTLIAQVFFPRYEYCTDNGAMVAYVGLQRLIMGEQDDLEIEPRARWSIDTL